MTMHRLPRKLKKGCRTLNGNPRTKWQYKGCVYIARTIEDITNKACAAAAGIDLLRQVDELVRPERFPPGGIVVSPQTKRMMQGESTEEIVLHRPQLDKLKHVIMVDSIDGVRAAMNAINIPGHLEWVEKKRND